MMVAVAVAVARVTARKGCMYRHSTQVLSGCAAAGQYPENSNSLFLTSLRYTEVGSGPPASALSVGVEESLSLVCDRPP